MACMNDVIDDLTPGEFDLGNASEIILALVAVFAYLQGAITTNTMLVIIGLAFGADNVSKLRKKGSVE